MEGRRHRRRHHAGARRRRFFREAPRAGALGLVILGTGALVGAGTAWFLDHYLAARDANSKDKVPQAIATRDQYNELAYAAKPGLKRILWQLGLAAFGIGAGVALRAWAHMPTTSLFFFGFGMGALGHLGVQVLGTYVVVPLMKKSDMGKQMFAHEINAAAAFDLTDTNKEIDPPNTFGALPPAATNAKQLPAANTVAAPPRTMADRVPRAAAVANPPPSTAGALPTNEDKAALAQPAPDGLPRGVPGGIGEPPPAHCGQCGAPYVDGACPSRMCPQCPRYCPPKGKGPPVPPEPAPKPAPGVTAARAMGAPPERDEAPPPADDRLVIPNPMMERIDLDRQTNHRPRLAA